jgi:hypothetical protein
MKATHYRIVVSPEDIIALNTTPICALLNPQFGDSPERLRALQGKVMILTDEFRFQKPRDRRELYLIPEVRAFCTKLKKDCPYWFYYFPLDVANLWLSTVATFEALVVERRPGVKQRTVHMNRQELACFVDSLAPATEELCKLAGHRKDFYPRLMKKVVDYYLNTRFEDDAPKRLLT